MFSLAAPYPSCRIQDLSIDCMLTLIGSMWDLVPRDPGIEPKTYHWEHRVLADRLSRSPREVPRDFPFFF